MEKATDNLFSSEKVCKTFYQILIKRKTSSPVKSQGKWLAEDLFSNVQVNWDSCFTSCLLGHSNVFLSL